MALGERDETDVHGAAAYCPGKVSNSGPAVCRTRDHTPKEGTMKYMILIYQGTTPLPGTPEWDALSQEQQGAVYAAYGELNGTAGFTSGTQMQGAETATTVQVKDGTTLTTDGPFAELKEAIGGYGFYEADDLDAAIALAAKIPAASMGGAIEIRPLVER
jgi:hypothetical protein